MDTQSLVTSKQGVQKIGMRVSNELPKQKDVNINLRDMLNDILFYEKHNLVSYQIAINEVLNDDLRSLLIENRSRLQVQHTNFFNELFNLGEYQADAATAQQIKDIYDVFNGYQVQIPDIQ